MTFSALKSNLPLKLLMQLSLYSGLYHPLYTTPAQSCFCIRIIIEVTYQNSNLYFCGVRYWGVLFLLALWATKNIAMPLGMTRMMDSGVEDPTHSQIWFKHAWLGYVNITPFESHWLHLGVKVHWLPWRVIMQVLFTTIVCGVKWTRRLTVQSVMNKIQSHEVFWC